MEMKFANIAIFLPGIAVAGPGAYAACEAAYTMILAADPGGVALYVACQSPCAPLLAIMPCI